MSLTVTNSSTVESAVNQLVNQSLPILSSAFYLYYPTFFEDAAQSLKSLGNQLWGWFKAFESSQAENVPVFQSAQCRAASRFQAKKILMESDCCLHDRFHYTHPEKSSSLFEIQNTISLSEGSSLVEVDMYDPPKVIHVSDKPVFLFTDHLVTCVAVLGKTKISDSSNLIGVAHLFTADWYNLKTINYSEFSHNLKNFILDVDRKSLLKKGHFIPQKLIDLVAEFLANPNYNGEKIELFFAGGNGSGYGAFWQDLLIQYAEQIPIIEVKGTYLNPFQETPEIADEQIRLPIHTLAGITNDGSIFLRKSCDFEFESPES